MDESFTSQYAIQIAVHALRDRCKTLQQRIALLEDENISLRIKNADSQENELHSMSEPEKLRLQVAAAKEQREHLQDKFKMVTLENQELWGKLGKLIDINKSLKEQLARVNDQTVAPVHTPTLIRSKTFTQHEPQNKFPIRTVEISEKISLELENVSLKISDNFAGKQREIEEMCLEFDECDYGIITGKFGFYFDDQLEEDIVDDLKDALEDLKFLKEEVLIQRDELEKNLENMHNLGSCEISCKSCDMRKIKQCEKGTFTDDIPKVGVDKYTEAPILRQEEKPISKQKQSTDGDKICPICSKNFKKDIDFIDFEQHVENHFVNDNSSYEIL